MNNNDVIYSQSIFKNPPSPITWREPSSRSRRGTYDAHIISIKNFCNSNASVYENDYPSYSKIIKGGCGCNSWDCPQCRTKKAKMLAYRIKTGIKGNEWRLVTLTFDPKKTDLRFALTHASQVWDVFSKRLKRRYRDLEFIKVLEFQANGMPHFHVIINKYIPHAYIKQAWTTLGGGEIVDIKSIKNSYISYYVSRYLSGGDEKHSKHNHQFYDFALRRFSFSRNFDIAPRLHQTIIYYSNIPWDLADIYFDRICDYIIDENVFIISRNRSYLKYLNLRTPRPGGALF